MSTYFRLIQYLKPHLRIFSIAVGCMLVSSFFGGIQLAALYPLADRVLTNQVIPSPAWLPAWVAAFINWLNQVPPLNMVTLIAVVIPFMFLLKGIFEVLQSFYMNNTAQRITRDLRQALFDRMIGL